VARLVQYGTIPLQYPAVMAVCSTFTRYSFTSKLYCANQSSFYCLPPPAKPTLLQYYCSKAYPIAILLHDHCAIYVLPPTPPFYAIHHTILAMAISCEGQTCPPPPPPHTQVSPLRRSFGDATKAPLPRIRESGPLRCSGPALSYVLCGLLRRDHLRHTGSRTPDSRCFW